MNKSVIPYEIYTDGSAKGNDPAHRLGGWAYCILYDGDIIRRDSGTEIDTTNQRMELRAAIEALKACENFVKPEAEFFIYSDSAYFINCYTQEWYKTWEKNKWRNSQNKPVANPELWGEILPYFKRRSFHFEKVKGHADNYYNNLVDEMAQKAASNITRRSV